MPASPASSGKTRGCQVFQRFVCSGLCSVKLSPGLIIAPSPAPKSLIPALEPAPDKARNDPGKKRGKWLFFLREMEELPEPRGQRDEGKTLPGFLWRRKRCQREMPGEMLEGGGDRSRAWTVGAETQHRSQATSRISALKISSFLLFPGAAGDFWTNPLGMVLSRPRGRCVLHCPLRLEKTSG